MLQQSPYGSMYTFITVLFNRIVKTFPCMLFVNKVQSINQWAILAVLQLFQHFPTKVVQIDLKWPILAILQLFQYFPTKVVQIDSEWPILDIL